ncbi:MAG: hypothetical protein HOO85_04315 [Methylotenera sp.]|nr:hypothetical protein [Methylotenera sp.]
MEKQSRHFSIYNINNFGFLMKTQSLKIIGIIMSAIFMSSCATAMLSTAEVSHTTSSKTLVMEDTIIATAKPVTNAEVAVSKNSIVLIGLNNTYHINEGSESISKLLTLDPKYMSLHHDNPIEFNIYGSKFNGIVDVQYTKDNYLLEELMLLNQLNFKSHTRPEKGKGEYFETSFRVKGNIYAKTNVNEAVAKNFSAGRKIKFVTTEYKRSVDAGRMADKLIALPFAIAFDVVTAPVQLILFTSAAAGAANKK